MKISKIVSALLLGAMVTFSGCGSDDESNEVMSNTQAQVVPTTYSYTLSVTNLTAGQPMSPLLVTSNSIFSVGQSASEGLEKLAESGDNSTLLDSYGVSGSGLLRPGSSESISITTEKQNLSLATMLVKTNDGFAGVDGYDLSSLALNATTSLYLPVYDAGTEENSETNTTVPGLNGEGYNLARESANIVRVHSGIISNEDGLASSHLSAQEKFNNPALVVMITRTK